MTFLETNFNEEGLEPAGEFKPIPAGEYLMILESDEKCVSKTDEANSYLKCIFQIIDGPHKNRKLFHNFNLWHSSADTQTFAMRQFGDLKRAVGVKGQINDTSSLQGQPIRAKVAIREAAKGYDAQNVIKMFIPKENAQTQTGATQQAATSQPESGTTPPPWGQQ